MNSPLSRRQVMTHVGVAGSAAVLADTLGSVGSAAVAQTAASATQTDLPAIRYCLNTSTIRGQKIPIDDEVRMVAKAGYDAIEPWMNELQAYVEAGKSLSDLRKLIADQGLTVESAIGFASWIVDDDAQRAKGLETAKRDMDLLRQIGGRRIAAPPVGATDQTDLNLQKAAERYIKLIEIGRSLDVIPQLEVWGFSKSLSRLGEVVQVAIESGQPDACVLPDVYHLFKGGSDFRGLALIHGPAIQVMHLNDYPGDFPRETIADKDRVYPGDGIAPIPQLIRQLRFNGFAGTFSLELFNPTYWQQPAEQVVRTGLQKMKDVVAASDSATAWTSSRG